MWRHGGSPPLLDAIVDGAHKPGAVWAHAWQVGCRVDSLCQLPVVFEKPGRSGWKAGQVEWRLLFVPLLEPRFHIFEDRAQDAFMYPEDLVAVLGNGRGSCDAGRGWLGRQAEAKIVHVFTENLRGKGWDVNG